MWIGGIIFALGILGVLLKRRYRSRFFQETIRKKELLRPVFGIAAFLYDRIRQKWPEKEADRERTQALLIGPGEDYLSRVRIIACGYMLVLAGAFFLLISGISAGSSSGILAIERPVFGEQLKTDLSVSGLDEKYELKLDINGQDPDEEAMMAYFDELYQQMWPVWLGENTSCLEIRSNLELTDESDSGVSFDFESGDRQIITNYGYLIQSNLTEEGQEVLFTVRLVYKSYEKQYEKTLRIYPPKAAELSLSQRLLNYLETLEKDTQDQAELTLPLEFEGRQISFSTSQNSPYLLPVVISIIGVLLYFVMMEQRKDAYKKRNASLERSFVAMLSKISTLMDAGMSAKGAWGRIVRDYQERLRKTGKKEYLYEEMLITAHEMATGVSETDAFAAFGRRCRLREYVKFGNLLAQNVRQGISGLNLALKVQMKEALDERKNRAIRKGEQAGTKQLFPMLLMLLVVIIILIVPALTSF